jgi:homoserine kinase
MTVRRVHLRVPATTANLGPGFDCLGMALHLHNELIVEVTGERLSIDIEGEGSLLLPRDQTNLIYTQVQKVFERAGRETPPVHVIAHNGIPLDRGLGSSAAAIVSGLMAGNVLCGEPCDRHELLRMAATREGHPDNVAPALLGGAVVSILDGEQVRWCSLRMPEFQVVLFVPDFAISTRDARRMLPALISRSDAVFNVGRAALLVASLSNGCVEHLEAALDDRLHQPYREQLFPGMRKLFAAAHEAGALGSFLSGAGSTLIALCESGGERVAAAMDETATRLGISAHTKVTSVSSEGAVVVSAE